MNTTHTRELTEQKESWKENRLLGELDLRDYFAAKAMQGILFEGLTENETARHAYLMADAMLKARKE